MLSVGTPTGRMLRALMLALAIAPAIPAASQAAAVTFTGVCKHPIADKQPTAISVEADIPTRWNRYAPPSAITWKIRLVDGGQGGAYWYRQAGASATFGTAALAVTVRRPDGSTFPLRVPVKLDRWDRSAGIPAQFTLTGTSSVPTSFTFDRNGAASFTVTGLVPTISVNGADGSPMLLRQLPTDFDGYPYSQSDNDRYTTDLLCRPDPGANTKIATTSVTADGVPPRSTSFFGECKHPNIDRQPSAFTVEASVPERWSRSAPPTSVSWKLRLVDRGVGAAWWYATRFPAAITGTVTLSLAVRHPDGSTTPLRVPLALQRWNRSAGVPQNFTLTGSSSLRPGFAFRGDGTASFAVIGIVPTIALLRADGTLQTQHDISAGLDGELYTQSDTDPFTTDILCRPGAYEATRFAITQVVS